MHRSTTHHTRQSLTARFASSILVALVAATLFSCEELFFEPEPSNTNESLFYQAWKFADEEYSFFAFKEVSWDDVYDMYAPQVNNDMTEEELFDVIANMLYELEDGHVNLKSDFNRSRYWQWYLVNEPSYDFSVLERYYLTDGGTDTVGRSDYRMVGDAFILKSFDDVGYIHYRSFGTPIRPRDMDYVIETFEDKKGLIIDLRDNGGGSLSNVFAIGDRLVGEKTKVAEEEVKTGPGHDELSEPRPLNFEPPEDRPTYTGKPVVVLINNLSYSATNYFAASTKALDNVILMGQRSGGGGGAPAFTMLSNGWILRVSTTRLYTLDGDNVEDGVAPDMEVASPEAELATGVDNILETAIDYIRAQ